MRWGNYSPNLGRGLSFDTTFVVGLITGQDYTTGINIPTILVSIVGAIILIGAYRLLTGSRLRT